MKVDLLEFKTLAGLTPRYSSLRENEEPLRFFRQAQQWVAQNQEPTVVVSGGKSTKFGGNEILIKADLKKGKFIASLNGKQVVAKSNAAEAFNAARDALVGQIEKDLMKKAGHVPEKDQPNFVADYFAHLKKHKLG